jgi:hypothetical protein
MTPIGPIARRPAPAYDAPMEGGGVTDMLTIFVVLFGFLFLLTLLLVGVESVVQWMGRRVRRRP